MGKSFSCVKLKRKGDNKMTEPIKILVNGWRLYICSSCNKQYPAKYEENPRSMCLTCLQAPLNKGD